MHASSYCLPLKRRCGDTGTRWPRFQDPCSLDSVVINACSCCQAGAFFKCCPQVVVLPESNSCLVLSRALIRIETYNVDVSRNGCGAELCRKSTVPQYTLVGSSLILVHGMRLAGVCREGPRDSMGRDRR